MRVYVVAKGDHLPAIAESNGFARHDAIWSHPDNAELKKARGAAEILLPGDQLQIPDPEEKTVEVPDGQKHRFVVKSEKLELRLRIRDIASAPLGGASAILAVSDGNQDLTTDGDGQIIAPILRSERKATLTVGEAVYEIGIGDLDPVDSESGWQARLVNLGYLEGLLPSPVATEDAAPPDEPDPEDGPPYDEEAERAHELRAAIEEFQLDGGLGVTGEMDDATQARLRELHGC
ncbi:MAG: peptidoglycan-binding domain-containing protein [Byssovorax sp.]